MKTYTDVMNAAHKLLAKFQTGKINRDELYAEGVEITRHFQALTAELTFEERQAAATDTEVQAIVDLLTAIKHFATC